MEAAGGATRDCTRSRCEPHLFVGVVRLVAAALRDWKPKSLAEPSVKANSSPAMSSLRSRSVGVTASLVYLDPQPSVVVLEGAMTADARRPQSAVAAMRYDPVASTHRWRRR